ncbi:hypothetical protein ACWGLF_08650 [Streptomyces puniciscabiei]
MIATIVVSLSAVFTGVNVIVSALTYRRVKPRVEVNSMLLGDFELAEEGTATFGFRLHVRNLSPTAAKLESVHVVGWMRLRHPVRQLFRNPLMMRGSRSTKRSPLPSLGLDGGSLTWSFRPSEG